MKTGTLILLVTFFAIFSPADGQDRSVFLEQMFSRFDRDGDGKISKEEAPEEFWTRMGRSDENRDGKLDKAEAAAAVKAMAGRLGPGGGSSPIGRGEPGKEPGKRPEAGPDSQERMRQLFQQFDRSGKGNIALADLPESLRSRLAPLDINGDKHIDRKEMQRIVLQQDMRDGAMGSPEQMFERTQAMLKDFDRDGDGRVALSDLPPPLQDRFTRLDTNKDGQIEKSELRSLPEIMKAGGGRYEDQNETTPQKPKRPPKS